MKTLRLVGLVTLLGLLVGGLSGCGTNNSSEFPTGGPAIIDVRSASEYEKGHIQGAINIEANIPDLETRVATWEKSRRYFVYGTNDAEATAFHDKLVELGFTRVGDLGMMDHAADILLLPIEK